MTRTDLITFCLVSRFHFPLLELGHLERLKRSPTASVVVWVEETPNEKAITDCEDPAVIFSTSTIWPALS